MVVISRVHPNSRQETDTQVALQKLVHATSPMTVSRAVIAALRPQLNRIVVGVALVTALPAIAVAERMHRGSGRGMARRCIDAVGRICGVTFDVRGCEVLDEVASCIVVANHSSLLDIPALLVASCAFRLMPKARKLRRIAPSKCDVDDFILDLFRFSMIDAPSRMQVTRIGAKFS